MTNKDKAYATSLEALFAIQDYAEDLKEPVDIHAFILTLGRLVGQIETIGGGLCDKLEELAPDNGPQYFRDYVIWGEG